MRLDEFGRQLSKEAMIQNLDRLRTDAAMDAVSPIINQDRQPNKLYMTEVGGSYTAPDYISTYRRYMERMQLSPLEQEIEAIVFEKNKQEIIAASKRGIRDINDMPVTLRQRIPGMPKIRPRRSR